MTILLASNRLSGMLLVAVVMLAGCATSRDVVTPQVNAGHNPPQGIAVRIEKIEDARSFETEPSDASTPSLMDDKITDKALRGRAIARKRNTFGKALGDVLLPEGQSVVSLTVSAITRSFRDAGYRVISADDPNYAEALPVTAKIDKLWAWFRPGFWAISLEANYDIVVGAPIASLQPQARLSGQVREAMQMATSDDWATIVKKSLDDFSAHLKEKLLVK
jgi:hypothetical protein